MLRFLTLVIVIFTLGKLTGVPPVNQDQALFHAKEAYIAGYPLVLQELIRKRMTEGEFKKASMGQFVHERELPNPDSSKTEWANPDALYSLAWINLAKEPYLLTVPKLDGRLFLFPIVNGWNEEVFTIRKEGNYALVGPGWKGSLPEGVTPIRTRATNVFIPGRIFSSGTSKDLEKVHEIQDGIALKPLSFDENDALYSIEEDSTSENSYFTILAKTLKGNLPKKEKDLILDKFARVGIKEGSISHSDRKIASALESVPQARDNQITPQKKQEKRSGWTYSLEEGVFGADYMRKNLPSNLGQSFLQEAIFLFTNVDITNVALNGRDRYFLHFSKETIPKVQGMWSLTAYDDLGNLVKNPLNRYAIRGDSVNYNPDGSLDIYIQNRFPGIDKEKNWLPVAAGKFSLMLRLYLPEKSLFDKNWAMPGVKKEEF